MVMDLLATFGRPQDVADRYRSAGFTVIRPADAPRFAWVALGGVALQWVLTLPAVFTGSTGMDEAVATAGGSDDWLMRLSFCGSSGDSARSGGRDFSSASR